MGTPGVREAMVAELTQAQRTLAEVDLPPLALIGWEGLCAAEYTAAAGRVLREVAAAARALEAAVVAAWAL